MVAVVNQLDAVNISNGYTYKSELTPVITEVSPRRGGTAGGTRLTISGSGFRCSKGRDSAVSRGHNGETHPDYTPLVKNKALGLRNITLHKWFRFTGHLLSIVSKIKLQCTVLYTAKMRHLILPINNTL